ncbi:MAG: LytR C-terminal domain-containing protein [candidate division Zixibacteria bacterium]|nr:LytR C-terminal domain-containing protein [candidate division Zixibacteria bacterium]
MFLKRKSQKKKNRFYKTSPKKYKLSPWDYLLLTLTISVALFVTSVAQKWGQDSTISTPEQLAAPEILRVQVLNACGVTQVAQSTSDRVLRHNANGNYYFDVVDKANFKDFDIAESFVTYHNREYRGAAEELCRVIGIPDRQVVEQDFGNNFMEIDLKIVVGQDYSTYLAKE